VLETTAESPGIHAHWRDHTPDWNSVFCEFPDAARKARQWAMNHAAETNALVFTTHFAESSAGRVSRESNQPTWHFV
jgi:hypothetical protein